MNQACNGEELQGKIVRKKEKIWPQNRDHEYTFLRMS